MKTQNLIITLLFAICIFSLHSCKHDPTDPNPDPDPNENCELEDINASSNVKGYGILEKLPAIWIGPVSSPTPLGSFPEWIVDFRPISPSQVSAKNELNAFNDIFMSFFVARHDCEYKMAFRNGGTFMGNVRNSYMFVDSVYEGPEHSFYRFVDPISGGNRVNTNITFKQDSLIIHTYTNQFNTLEEPVTHMRWTADKRDITSTQDAVTHFSYPQKQLTKDFTTTFDDFSDAVFYDSALDPYPESEQPHLGQTLISVNLNEPQIFYPNNKIIIIVSTQPLFDGLFFNPARLDNRSRYVFLDAAGQTEFNFNYMHPGSYYVNALYDSNGDLNFSSGDYINAPFDIPVTLESEDNIGAVVNIELQIP